MRRLTSYGSITSSIIVVVSVVAAILLLLHRQWVVDQLSVWQYKPSSEVASLTTRAGMNGNGVFYFYASHPQIEEASNFNKNCGRKEASAAILGCYNGHDIFIYNVTNAKLDGIREVTAAHEMLHAVYARLNEAEKSRVGELLTAEYEKLKNDKTFAERMAFYDRTEPGERENELHSIIGTEVQSISPELEDYYKKYFSERHKTVALHQGYATVFNDLQKRGEEISNRLNQLAATIESSSAHYNHEVVELNKDIETFNTRASNGGFTSEGQFNAERVVLVSRARQLEVNRASINTQIAEYNALRDELAVVASESEALSRSIDSNLAPAPSL